MCPLPGDTSDVQGYRAINDQIRPRLDENEMRLNIARNAFPGYYSIIEIRNHARLAEMDRERRQGLQRLKVLTSTVSAEHVAPLISSGIIASLVELAAFRWCQQEIEPDAARIVARTAAVASHEQVRALVSMGCIPLLCDGVRSSGDAHEAQDLITAIKRIIETGQADAAAQGRNIYADQIEGAGGLDHLKELQKRTPRSSMSQGDPFEGVFRLFDSRAAATQSLAAILHDRSERGQGWNLLYPFLGQGRFLKWTSEDAATFHRENACPLKIKLFISHRWETLQEPDPQGDQLRSLAEYLSRVFMIANGYLDKESYVAKELKIGESLLAQVNEQNVSTCRCGTAPYLDLRSLLGHSDLFYSRVTDIHARRNLYQLLRHVHVWYDYASMPQAPRTADEQVIFEQRLNQLADIAGQSEVIILWGAESLSRAWCVLEGIVGQHLHFCAPAATPIRSLRDQFFHQVVLPHWEQIATGEARNAGYRGRNSLSISVAVRHSKGEIHGKSEGAILEYFEQHGLTCTHPEDGAIVAKLLHRFAG